MNGSRFFREAAEGDRRFLGLRELPYQDAIGKPVLRLEWSDDRSMVQIYLSDTTWIHVSTAVECELDCVLYADDEFEAELSKKRVKKGRS